MISSSPSTRAQISVKVPPRSIHESQRSFHYVDRDPTDSDLDSLVGGHDENANLGIKRNGKRRVKKFEQTYEVILEYLYVASVRRIVHVTLVVDHVASRCSIALPTAASSTGGAQHLGTRSPVVI